jgi:hypothetical protein
LKLRYDRRHRLMSIDVEKDIIDESSQPPYTARTPLGEKLLRLRSKIMAKGEPLLDWEAVEKEIADRRGGYKDSSV